MPEDQYEKGLVNIRGAADQALETLGVKNALVELAQKASDSKQPEVTLSISSGGKTQSQVFSRDEVLDSGEAIDAPAALKVRMLVSHFVK